MTHARFARLARLLAGLALALFGLATLAACDGAALEDCVAGETRACTCASGARGSETCTAAGTGFTGCSCPLEDAGGSDAGGDTPRDAGPVGVPDAGPREPVDCAGVIENGWSLCAESADTCSLVFSDSTGCGAACAALGLSCRESSEDVDGACMPDDSLPGLGCADTGHISDHCVCGRGLDDDAGVGADAGPGVDAGSGTDAGAGSDAGADAGAPAPCAGDRPWECILEEAVGFGGGVTGGAGGSLCWVENLASSGAGSLRSCIDAPGPTWIVFRVSGTIRLSANIPSDTTIDGRGQNVVIEGVSSHLFSIGNVSNVFLTHLTLVGAMYDLVHTSRTGTDVWLNHLTLEDAGDELLGLDGANATVSWCHLRNNGYAILIGGTMRDDSLYITLHHNHFEGNRERHPRLRGRVHSFNNYVDYASSGARVSDSGHLLSERNIYRTSGTGPALQSRTGGAVTVPGHYRSFEDTLRGGARLDTDNDPSPVFVASSRYAYTLEAADAALEARVVAGAGWQAEPLPMP